MGINRFVIAEGSVALYELINQSDYSDPANRLPLTNPKEHLDKIFYHSDLDYLQFEKEVVWEFNFPNIPSINEPYASNPNSIPSSFFRYDIEPETRSITLNEPLATDNKIFVLYEGKKLANQGITTIKPTRNRPNNPYRRGDAATLVMLRVGGGKIVADIYYEGRASVGYIWPTVTFKIHIYSTVPKGTGDLFRLNSAGLVFDGGRLSDETKILRKRVSGDAPAIGILPPPKTIDLWAGQARFANSDGTYDDDVISGHNNYAGTYQFDDWIEVVEQ